MSKKELSFRLVRNYVGNVLKVKTMKNPRLKPLFFTYYTNLSCNFDCSYCGYPKRKQTESDKPLNTDDTIKLMGLLKDECPNIYFTGGEPTLRSDLEEIIRVSSEIGFKSISLNTNMSLIHKNMGTLKHLTNLIASFHTGKIGNGIETLNGSPRNLGEQIITNMQECAELQESEGFKMTMNYVVKRDTIAYVERVMEFCFDNKIRFAIVPGELEGGAVDENLRGNKKYIELINRVIGLKKEGKPIFGTKKYLETIRDFKPFKCHPTLTPHIYPNGDLFYPCQPMRKVAGNILEAGSYRRALEEGELKFGELPSCKDRCHKSCYIEPSNIMNIKNLMEFIR